MQRVSTAAHKPCPSCRGLAPVLLNFHRGWHSDNILRFISGRYSGHSVYTDNWDTSPALSVSSQPENQFLQYSAGQEKMHAFSNPKASAWCTHSDQWFIYDHEVLWQIRCKKEYFSPSIQKKLWTLENAAEKQNKLWSQNVLWTITIKWTDMLLSCVHTSAKRYKRHSTFLM